MRARSGPLATAVGGTSIAFRAFPITVRRPEVAIDVAWHIDDFSDAAHEFFNVVAARRLRPG